MGFSEAVRNAMLDHYFDNATLTAPTNIFVALVKADDSEPVGGGYARVSTDETDWDAAAGGAIANGTQIVFPAPSASWGSITGVKLFDAATAGNELAAEDLPSARDVTAITPAPTFEIGDLRALIT